jgi:hypothetical protein
MAIPLTAISSITLLWSAFTGLSVAAMILLELSAFTNRDNAAMETRYLRGIFNSSNPDHLVLLVD